MKKLIAVLTALGILTTGIYMPNNYNSALVSITASAETSSEDFEFDAETGTITWYFGTDEIVEIPSEIDGVAVTSIGTHAFYKNENVKSIIIPDSITSIGDYAFEDCVWLKSVIIPDSVTNIGNCAFNQCVGLNSITIPDSVTDMGSNVFLNIDYILIKGSKNSYAETYAYENDLRFVSVDTPYSFGDITGDGVIDATDASLILTSYAESSIDEDDGMTDEQRIFADVNKDYYVDATDASAVLTYYARTSIGYKKTFNEYLNEFVFEKEETNPDRFFKAEIKTHEISKDSNGNEKLTVVFEFTNVFHDVMAVNGKPYNPNEIWEKKITFDTDKCEDIIKNGGCINYAFYIMEMPFSGGLFFKLDENLDVVEYRGFLD